LRAGQLQSDYAVASINAPSEQSHYIAIGGCKVQRTSVSRAVIIGWIIELVGMALWRYGYFATGNPSLIDCHANTPRWIADFLAEHRNADSFVAATA